MFRRIVCALIQSAQPVNDAMRPGFPQRSDGTIY
jgi:hypothetical protein